MRYLRSLLISAVFASAALAQTSSSITGVVMDQSQAVIPGAKIVVTAQETNSEYRTETNSFGYYTVPSLAPLNYTVAAEAPGLKKSVSAVFKLDAASTARIDLTLVPADSRQIVEVTATPAAINTESGMLGQTVSNKEVTDLPFQGRNALNLVTTVAGVGGEMQTDELGQSLTPGGPGAGVSISGGRVGTTGFMVDGSASSGITNGRAAITLSTDTVQEIKVITSNYSAQYGSVGSGVVSVVSKSGTDRLHGSAFWSQRNPALGARAFNASTAPRARRNEFGTTLGGPVYLPKLYDGRKKTFFFVSIEPKRYSNVNDFLVRVPTAAERQGDFRNSYVAPGSTRPLIYQQFQCAPSDTDCSQFSYVNRASSATLYPLMCADCPPDQVGHVIPKQFLDPKVQYMLSKVPFPNMPYDSQGNNYLGITGNDGVDNRWNLKIDHTINAKNRLTGRFTDIPIHSEGFQFQRAPEPRAYPAQSSDTKQFFLSYSTTITPRIVNEVRASYQFGNYSVEPPYDVGTKNYTTDVYGLPSLAGWGYPQFQIQSVPYQYYGSYIPQNLGLSREHQYQLSDDLTMVLGKHTLTIGADARLQQYNIKGNDIGRQCCGDYVFTTSTTSAGNSNAPGGAGGDAVASFLLGATATIQVRGTTVPYYYRWKVGAEYVQDDFKVKHNLTLNLGVRWQYNSPRAEKYDRQASIDIDNPVKLTDAQGRTTGYTFNYLYAGIDGRSIYLEPVHKNGFEPRIGFAWTPDFDWNRGKKLVVRGGYAISHMPETGRSRTALPDFGMSAYAYNYQTWVGTGASPISQGKNSAFPIRIANNPEVIIPNPILTQIPPNGVLCAGCPPVDPRVPGGSLISFPNSNQLPYLQSWNLTIQKELPHSLALTISYIGSKGTHLYSPGININTPDQTKIGALLDQGISPQESVPDPYGRVDAGGNLRLITEQDLARPYPTVGDVVIQGVTTSNSVYHGGSAEIERRFARGLGFRFNYTWSKSIDNTSDSNFDGSSFGSFGSTRWQDALDLRGNRSVSVFDTRHRFNYTASYELPFGKGKAVVRNAGRALNLLVGGWQLNAVGSLVSGYPFQAALGDRNGFASQPTGGNINELIRPDIIPGVPIINPLWNKSVANDVPYFNPAAFARPGYDRKGNEARTLDYARIPWKQNLNASMLKNVYPFEDRTRFLQMRWEFYNVLNHAIFSPATNSSLFSSTPPVSPTGLSLAGPIPYYPTVKTGTYATGSREQILGQYYNQAFGVIGRTSNGSGRVIQFVLRLYF